MSDGLRLQWRVSDCVPGMMVGEVPGRSSHIVTCIFGDIEGHSLAPVPAPGHSPEMHALLRGRVYPRWQLAARAAEIAEAQRLWDVLEVLTGPPAGEGL